jgi:hypothetical protein
MIETIDESLDVPDMGTRYSISGLEPYEGRTKKPGGLFILLVSIAKNSKLIYAAR